MYSTCRSRVCCHFSDKCLCNCDSFSAVFPGGAKILHYLFISVTFSAQIIETQCHHHSYLLWVYFSNVYIIYRRAKLRDLSVVPAVYLYTTNEQQR